MVQNSGQNEEVIQDVKDVVKILLKWFIKITIKKPQASGTGVDQGINLVEGDYYLCQPYSLDMRNEGKNESLHFPANG